MIVQNAELLRFYSTLETACTAAISDERSRTSLQRLFGLLQEASPRRTTPGSRQPVCNHLASAFSASGHMDDLQPLIAAFATIEPDLEWKPRNSSGSSASANFATSHANAMVAGPGGLEERDDLWLGVSLLAPHVRYPDHTHPPEETYLVLSEGDFMQGADNWFTPGIGGSFYNPPGVLHAMRSGETPLLAIWALLPDQVAR